MHSHDGTRIGFRRLGSGPAVVFVHGSVSTHTDWMPVARLLASSHTCFVMDRRGRRGSGAGHSPYCIEREYEDVLAVRVAAGPGAFLVGHSYGAICALGSAMLSPAPRLVLYEPPLAVGGPIAGENLAVYSRAVAEGDLDYAMEIGLSRFTRLSDDVIAAIRVSRAWPRLRALAASWIRELEAMDQSGPSVTCYSAITCPVLMLAGDQSPEHPMLNASRALARVLPNVCMETLTGQGHTAMRSAPELVARLIGGFLSA